MSRNIAAALVADLRARGVHLGIDGRDILVRAPRGAVSRQEREALRVQKPAILKRLEHERRICDLSLSEFAEQDHAIEIRVPFQDQTLWLVPRVEHVEALLKAGVARGRIWTGRELLDLSRLPTRAEAFQDIARVKQILGAEVVEITTDAEDPNKRSPQLRCPNCRSACFWRSVYGVTVCSTCHPPASPDLVAEWIYGGGEAS